MPRTALRAFRAAWPPRWPTTRPIRPGHHPLRELTLSLDQPPFAHRTGRGVTVAVIDSGINPLHPHLNGVAGGIALFHPAVDRADFADRLGHGTAVAAAIHEKAPDAALYAVRVFADELRASAGQLAEAMDWASDQGLHLLNLSLGTPRPERSEVLASAVARARERGAVVVSAGEHEGLAWLPGCLPGVVRVALDWACDRHHVRITVAADGTPTFHASGYPRPVPGVPPERNLKGVSFAVANVSGLLARLLEASPGARSPQDLVDLAKVDERDMIIRD